MPFLDHLEELRWRILWSLLAIVVATVVGWVLVERVDVIGLLIRPIKPLLPDGKLKFTHPTEPFFITLKFAFVLGLVLSSPVVIYQAWAFLAPALYPREKRLIVPALSAGVVLFLVEPPSPTCGCCHARCACCSDSNRPSSIRSSPRKGISDSRRRS